MVCDLLHLTSINLMIFSPDTEGVRVFIHVGRLLQFHVVTEFLSDVVGGGKHVVIFHPMDEHRRLPVGTADGVKWQRLSQTLVQTALSDLVLVSVVSVSVDGLLNDGGTVEGHVVVILATENLWVVIVELVSSF